MEGTRRFHSGGPVLDEKTGIVHQEHFAWLYSVCDTSHSRPLSGSRYHNVDRPVSCLLCLASEALVE